ncbi:hypothetical protein Ocin01_05782 [Orchesella cincta]|uniref:Uncharacterized protein n=1 Tax=Orchesella cincta TaxID=48709 RepID=A0A1D2N6Q2_ORCCI|nr:hypothetical protein Ocin01_05782 [Orchesella cincta]
MTMRDDDDDEEDELIKRYFSGLSSAGSSISWAEDAMESGFTTQLRKLWDDIEMVCRGGSRPKEICRNEDVEVSPAESPTLDEERGEGDAQFSSLVHSSRFEMGRKDFDDKVDLLQASFRSLNCTTPRPNIEKSTEYVSAWLSECQNSYVPEGDRTLPDYNNRSRPSTPSTSVQNASMQLSNEIDNRSKGIRIVSDVARSSCAHYSKSHAKFVAEPDPQNFFTSLAITSNENGYGAYPSRNDGGIPNSTDDMHPSGSYLFNYRSRIKESDEEEEDDDRSSPTDIISFRPNVRVQRPISSRIRDHTITPIATGSYAHSTAFHGRHHGVNLNRQQTATTNARSNSLPQSQGTTGLGGRIGIFDNSYVSIPTSATAEARTRRIHSGLTKPAHSIQQYGRSRQSLVSSIGQQQQQQQAPWSRFAGDDLVMESNYVTSLYENYQTGGGSTEAINFGGRANNLMSMRSNELVRSPTSPKDSLIKFQRSPTTDDGSISIPECEDRTFKPAVSWLMNRVSPH